MPDFWLPSTVDLTQIVDLKRCRSLELALVTTKRVLHDKASPNHAIWMVGSYHSWRCYDGFTVLLMVIVDDMCVYLITWHLLQHHGHPGPNQPIANHVFGGLGFSGLVDEGIWYIPSKIYIWSYVYTVFILRCDIPILLKLNKLPKFLLKSF